MKIKTRFAPSPTGNLHIGSIRTALYSWLFARAQNGIFILRIEDTDIKRSTQESVDTIINSLKWLNLDWDEGPYFQSNRIKRYHEVINDMLSKQIAYKCYCSPERLSILRKKQISMGQKPKYDGKCRSINKYFNSKQPFVVRFYTQRSGNTEFNDLIRGHIKFNNKELDDLIIQRSDGSPTYNFCVVVDDYDMAITHVIRGEEHINNTPRQINILNALGSHIPQYAHVSMILGHDSKKISKRHDAISIMQYRYDGFLPEAILNYLVRLGWSYGDQDIFNLDEMKKLFNINAINKSPSIFDKKKLLWYNHHYMNKLPTEYIANHLSWHMKQHKINTNNGPQLSTLVELLRKRCDTFTQMIQDSYYLYNDFDEFNSHIAKKYLHLSAYNPLKMIYTKLSELNNWTVISISTIINQTIKELKLNMSEIGMPLRVAITGNDRSPSLDVIIYTIGKIRCLTRIKAAINYISKRIQ